MSEIRCVRVPGRVNLIGEHIDYHGLPVLPIAITRSVHVEFRKRDDRLIRASSEPYGVREFEWTEELLPVAAGDWENYLRAAARTVAQQWGIRRGVDATIESDLPAAAGLSSSTALLVAFVLGLLDERPSFEELMHVLPEGEHFVGTRGGAMDHAAVLASRSGYASLISFRPISVRHVPIPEGWGFLAAHSMVISDKSGAARERYNAARRGSELHVITESQRVADAVAAMEQNDAETFGRVLVESHASLRDRLGVSCPELDRLVEAALESGALGARLTGAGFGGCAVVFAMKRDLPAVRERLIRSYYAGQAGFDAARHLIEAEPSSGVLYQET